ncbi:MAG: hypothetical protein KA120_00445 [Candidatus Goldbacteria bacterium]|nr:hypothetical protein [Candidatus Goldiibacteriota bacterium]
MKWITSLDLKQWAPTTDCRSYLPYIVNQLINAESKDIKSINIPSGDNIYLPGFDGKVESINGSSYIPQGLSVWEIGTSNDPQKKANEDYEKRKSNPRGVEQKNATYIFITPQVWPNKDKWEKEKNTEGIWKNVKAYDGCILEEWIEKNPAVGAHLAKHITKFQDNCQALDDFWAEWSNSCTPSLNFDILFSSRDSNKNKIIEWLRSGPSIFALQGDTKDESMAFLISVINSLTNKERDFYLAKSIIVGDYNSFKHIVTTSVNDLIIIANFDELDKIRYAIQKGHKIFIPLENGNNNIREKEELQRITREGFINALIKMGINQTEAEKLCLETGRSITSLRRRLMPVHLLPSWAKPEIARELLPLLFIGEWTEENEADKDIVSFLAGEKYEDYINKISKWLHKPDSPIIQINRIWHLKSQREAWQEMGQYLNETDFKKFEQKFLEVFRTINPKLDLKPEDRWKAATAGKINPHSQYIRKGMATALLIPAIFSTEIGLKYPLNAQLWADHIIKQLLEGANGALWYSVADVLTIISEASPLSFLSAIEKSLSEKKPPVMDMFTETKDSFTSNSMHTHLLWALEELAWDPKSIIRISLILSKLDKLDSGGKMANRPFGSLLSIFSTRRPQTFASMDERLEAIDEISKIYPDTCWKIMIDLIPETNFGILMPSNKPTYRKFTDRIEKDMTYAEFSAVIDAIIARLLRHVGTDDKKWIELVKRTTRVSSNNREICLTQLKSVLPQLINKRDLRKTLRTILSKHRSFKDADWALKEEDLTEYKQIFNILESEVTDLIEKYDWLFEEYWPELPEGRELYNHDLVVKIVNEKREMAISDIYSNLGIDGLLELSKRATNIHFICWPLSNITIPETDVEKIYSWLEDSDDKKVQFAETYIFQKYREGNKYVESIFNYAKTNMWSEKKKLNLCLAFPQSRKIWQEVGLLSESFQKDYWLNSRMEFQELDNEDREYAIREMIKVNRFFAALDTAWLFHTEISSQLIIDLLTKIATEESAETNFRLDTYKIEGLFEALDKTNIDINEIAKLEWMYLPILSRIGGGRPPKVLHKILSTQPDFFAEVIKFLFKPKKEQENEEKEPTEIEKEKAFSAYRLLEEWYQIPGYIEGVLDEQFLREWVKKAREYCNAANRLEYCDNTIGKLFAYSSADGNGNWPHEVIASIIEEIQTDEILDGFFSGILNSRGVVTKGHLEGGIQERKLAEKYKKFSKQMYKYPKIASVLQKVAQHYEYYATSEDKRAENTDWEN